MTDRTKFEAMLEALINEDHEAAKDIFHNIVVGKSREIYERLLAEEFEEEEDDDADDTEDDDMFGADDEEGEDDEFGADDEEDDDMFGADDEGDDEFGDDEFGDDEFGDEADGDLENRVLDLEDALDELKSEFEQLLAGEEDEPEHDDMFGADDAMGGDEMGLGGDEFGAGEEENEFQSMFEYVNKVALPKHGDDGLNNKSIFNKPKYNDMGGTALKFAQESQGAGTKGGLLNPSTADLTKGMKIHNRKDSKAGKTAFKSQQPGHGAEKKGKGESAPNTKSLIPGRK